MSLSRAQEEILDLFFKAIMDADGYVTTSFIMAFIKSATADTTVSSAVQHMQRIIELVQDAYALTTKEAKQMSKRTPGSEIYADSDIRFIRILPGLIASFTKEKFIPGTEETRLGRLHRISLELRRRQNALRLKQLPICLLKFDKQDDTPEFWEYVQKTYSESLKVKFDKEKTMDIMFLFHQKSAIDSFIQISKQSETPEITITGAIEKVAEILRFNTGREFVEGWRSQFTALDERVDKYKEGLIARRPVSLLNSSNIKIFLAVLAAIILSVFASEGVSPASLMLIAGAIIIPPLAAYVFDSRQQRKFLENLKQEQQQIETDFAEMTKVEKIQSLFIREDKCEYTTLYVPRHHIQSNQLPKQQSMLAASQDDGARLIAKPVKRRNLASSTVVESKVPKPVSQKITIQFENGLTYVDDYTNDNGAMRIMLQEHETLIVAFLATQEVLQKAKIDSTEWRAIVSAFNSGKVLGENEKGTGIKKQPSGYSFWHKNLGQHVISHYKVRQSTTSGCGRVISYRVPSVLPKGHHLHVFDTYVPERKAHKKKR